MSYAYTVEQIYAAEKSLLNNQETRDDLMRQAAKAVSKVALTMLQQNSTTLDGTEHTERNTVLILSGRGVNGGKELYAGALLAQQGIQVEAWLVTGTAHGPALDALIEAGATVIKKAPTNGDCQKYCLAIDALTGNGGIETLSPEASAIVDCLRDSDVPVLAIDVPSGVDMDTGSVDEVHVNADVTVAFGGFRLAHGLAPQCGQCLVADLGRTDTEPETEPITMSTYLVENNRKTTPQRLVFRATDPVQPCHSWPTHLRTMQAPPVESVTPLTTDNKYSGGVVGIRAGSQLYPGAGILAVSGAINATPSMVRYAGSQALEVVRAHPEAVVSETIAETGRVNAWVFGPGTNVINDSVAELVHLVGQDVPLLIDADGVTLLAEQEELRDLVVKRTAPTVLTPHDGEFARLWKACGMNAQGRLAETEMLARHLGAVIVRKGRATIIAGNKRTVVVDAGNSWAATPGSGDVLAGIMGARLARAAAQASQADQADYAIESALVQSVAIHAVAAQLSATTEFGEGPTSATKIANAVPAATAKLVAQSRASISA